MAEVPVITLLITVVGIACRGRPHVDAMPVSLNFLNRYDRQCPRTTWRKVHGLGQPPPHPVGTARPVVWCGVKMQRHGAMTLGSVHHIHAPSYRLLAQSLKPLHGPNCCGHPNAMGHWL